MKRIYRAYNPLREKFLLNIFYIFLLWFVSLFLLVLFEYFGIFAYFTLPYISFVSLMTSHWGNKARISLNGLSGEKKALSSIKKIPRQYKIFSNVILKDDGKESETDLIVIGDKGVFIVEIKNHIGTISGKESEHRWIQYKETKMDGKYTNPFYNPVKQVRTHVYRLSKVFKRNGHDNWIQGVVYFVNPNVKLNTKTHKIPVLSQKNDFVSYLNNFIPRKKLSKNQQAELVNIIKREIKESRKNR